jgi:hypothetical protein
MYVIVGQFNDNFSIILSALKKLRVNSQLSLGKFKVSHGGNRFLHKLTPAINKRVMSCLSVR